MSTPADAWLGENALLLAPMDGITDAPMRAMMGETHAFSFAVSEFVRVSIEAIPRKTFSREVPELGHQALTDTGLPVQVQILGGDPELMAESALRAVQAGATGIDLNFGCPAKTVNRHDGGATLLKYPERLERIVAAVRDAVPRALPVTAKLRLGWDDDRAVWENAARAERGGATWITIHARTRVQGYLPPVNWQRIAEVRRAASVPIIANGDIWNLDDFKRCQEVTGCQHFMLGRAALANPSLSRQIRRELGGATLPAEDWDRSDWRALMQRFGARCETFYGANSKLLVMRMKQWLNLAGRFGEFDRFHLVKGATSSEQLLAMLAKTQ